jgi:DNA replication protein DnaC
MTMPDLTAVGDIAERAMANAERAREEQQRREADPTYRRQRESDTARRLLSRMEAAGFPRRHLRNCTWDGVPEPERSQIEAWASVPDLMGMVISGSVGTGKTAAVVVACRELVERRGIEAHFVHAERLLDTLATNDRERNDRDTVERWTRCDLLVIDDLGAGGKRQAWVLGKFELLVNRRWEAALPTVVTTNLRSPDALAGIYGEPVRSRLCDPDAADVVQWTHRQDRRVGGTGWRET